MRSELILPMALALSACSGGTDTATPLDIAAGPVEGTLPGGDGVDVWRATIDADGSYLFSVDTVADDTTFDPWMDVIEVSSWGPDPAGTTFGTILVEANDEVDCTFPPPDFSCPEATLSLDAGDVAVVVGGDGEPAGSEYALTVTVDGSPVALELLGSTTSDVVY
jgi:hypothetical protein